jgi:hypothetical protein
VNVKVHIDIDYGDRNLQRSQESFEIYGPRDRIIKDAIDMLTRVYLLTRQALEVDLDQVAQKPKPEVDE